MTTQAAQHLSLERRDGEVWMYDATASPPGWFPLTDPDWGLDQQTVAFLQAQDVGGRNFDDFFRPETSSASPSFGTDEQGAVRGPGGQEQEGQSDLQVGPRPPGWVGTWPPKKLQKKSVILNEGGVMEETGTVDEEVIDEDKMREALTDAGFDPQTGEFSPEEEEELDLFPATQEGRAQAEEFLATAGVPDAQVVFDFKRGGWTIGEPEEDKPTGRVFAGPDGFSRAQQLINQVQSQALAQGVAPQNLRVAPRTLSNGSQVWEIEAFTPERSEPPLSFSEEMDRRQADAFRDDNLREFFRLESIRDEVARNPTVLDMGDAASYAARFAESPEEFLALAEAFNESFQRMSSVGIPPREFVEQQGPFAALEQVAPVTSPAQLGQGVGGAQPPGVPSNEFVGTLAAAAAADRAEAEAIDQGATEQEARAAWQQVFDSTQTGTVNRLETQQANQGPFDGINIVGEHELDGGRLTVEEQEGGLFRTTFTGEEGHTGIQSGRNRASILSQFFKDETQPRRQTARQPEPQEDPLAEFKRLRQNRRTTNPSRPRVTLFR